MRRSAATIALAGALGAALFAILAPARTIVKGFLKTRESSIQGYSCAGSSERVECRLDRKRIIWRR
jgi:hypothetical protein